MTHQFRLFALILALALSTAVNAPVRADGHGLESQQPQIDYSRRVQSLSDKKLRRLIIKLDAKLQRRGDKQTKRYLRAARAERAHRAAAGNTNQQPSVATQPAPTPQPSATPQPSNDEQQARALLRSGDANKLRTPALRKRINDVGRLLQARNTKKKTRKRLKRMMARDQDELQTRQAAQQVPQGERLAQRFLKNAGPARQLNAKQLNQRIARARQMLKSAGLRPATRKQLQQLVANDRAVLQSQNTAQGDRKAERQARRLLQGPASNELRTPAIEQRIKDARNLLRAGGLREKTVRRLKQLMARDNAVLKTRRAERQIHKDERLARRILKNAVGGDQLKTPALRERIRDSRALLGSEQLRDRTRRTLRQLVQSDRAELAARSQQTQISKAEREARELLASSRPAGDLNDRALRRQIRDMRALLQEPDVSRRTRIRLQARLDRDIAELRTRQAQSNDADEQAKELLADRRAPESLRERQLRKRLRETRDLLQDTQLSKRYSRRLRDRLSDDRRELRRRLEAKRLQEENVVVIEPRRDDTAAALLNDRRPAHSLRTKALSRRIKATQRALKRGQLAGYDRALLTDRLERDRRALRQRLRHRRERRRAELDRLRRSNDLNVVIAPQFDYAPRDDVAAAEADDQALEGQLLAPPTRRIERRYTMDEFRRRPDLRRYMPAIEVDSIHFGFNEHWVREEEIDELERIGAVIERVVAASPNEVFVIEGHTDAVGSYAYNQELSRKRADAVRNALVEYFVISPDNLATIGYGEQFLKIPTEEEEQENRRVSVRRITPLLAGRE